MKKSLLSFVFLLASLSALAAQDAWPTRPISFVVGSAPGGSTDLFARIIAQRLTETLKRPVIVENKPGASGNIGAGFVANSTPDGYTFLVASNQGLVITPILYKNLKYNAERDFAPVARGVKTPMVLVVDPAMPVKTLSDLVNLGKAQPGKIPYGTAGHGSTTYLSIRMLEELSGARFLHVPYAGVAQALQGLLTHDVKFNYTGIGTPLAMVKTGAVRPIVVTERTSHLPDVATFTEQGYPDLEQTFGTFSVVARSGTSSAIIQRLNAAINDAMRIPEVIKALDVEVLVPTYDTPEEYALSLKAEREKWAEFFRRNNITAQ